MFKNTYNDSKFVNPVNKYKNAIPNNINAEAKLPIKKYFNPALALLIESLFNVDNIYNEKDCNSIVTYNDKKSFEFIKQQAPIKLNKIISRGNRIIRRRFIIRYRNNKEVGKGFSE